jgi:predicted DNA-binding protein (MmcQ/YjbR family)
MQLHELRRVQSFLPIIACDHTCRPMGVGGKVFAIGSQHGTDKPAFSFKTSDHNFALLSDQSGYRPAPYLASRGLKWIQIYDTSCATSEEIKYYLAESHRIVALGLTKKLRKQLGLGNSEA